MIPVLDLSGTHSDIGFAHGKGLERAIHQAIEFYLSLFDLKEQAIKDAAKQFRGVIGEHAPVYIDEIEALAVGADVPADYIYLINARSEMLALTAAECTAVAFQKTGLLGQNWDWAQTLEPLVALLRMTAADGHRLLTFTEPGILAKIGFNSAGVGVCLNILESKIKGAGFPVHLCLRSALDAPDYPSARSRLIQLSGGKASHILLARDSGEVTGFEYCGQKLYRLEGNQDCLVHTNHYLARADATEAFPATRERLQRGQAMALASQRQEKADLEEILRDQSDGDNSIFQSYRYFEELNSERPFGHIGTVATLIMDLPERMLYVKPGSASDHTFQAVSIDP